MELNEIRDIATENRRSIAALDEWAQGIEKRVGNLEKAQNILTEVQISLRELAMQNKYFGEKLDEMKVTLEKISQENQQQHKDLNERIGKIESQPGERWNKAVWIIITAGLAAVVGYLLRPFL